MIPDPDLNTVLEKARADLEYVSVTSAKGQLGRSLEELQAHAEGLRELQRSLNDVPGVIVKLRREVHSARMALQSTEKEEG